MFLHYNSRLTQVLGTLTPQVLPGAWFEWQREGGCGAGELRLIANFRNRARVEVGDWIAIEPSPGNRWYLGRVEARSTVKTQTVVLQLEGMSAQLGEVFPGGFGFNSSVSSIGAPIAGDAAPAATTLPRQFGLMRRFGADPDHPVEQFDRVTRVEGLVQLLMQQFVVPATNVKYEHSLVEQTSVPISINSLKVNGEESVRSLLKDLSARVGNYAWGVNAEGQFFFLKPRTTAMQTYRLGQSVLGYDNSLARKDLVNRLLLTGGYVYESRPVAPNELASVYRYRRNYLSVQSRQQFGERRARVSIPWIRTQDDARTFAAGYFAAHDQPRERTTIQVLANPLTPANQLVPWLAPVTLLDETGGFVSNRQPEQIRATYGGFWKLAITLGPADPQTNWPDPGHDERWPIARAMDTNSSASDTLREDESSDIPPGSSGGGGNPSATTSRRRVTSSAHLSSADSTLVQSHDSTDRRSSSMTSLVRPESTDGSTEESSGASLEATSQPVSHTATDPHHSEWPTEWPSEPVYSWQSTSPSGNATLHNSSHALSHPSSQITSQGSTVVGSMTGRGPSDNSSEQSSFGPIGSLPSGHPPSSTTGPGSSGSGLSTGNSVPTSSTTNQPTSFSDFSWTGRPTFPSGRGSSASCDDNSSVLDSSDDPPGSSDSDIS